jgi:hypothetical protein
MSVFGRELGRILNVPKMAAEGHPLLERVMRNEQFYGNTHVSPCTDGLPLGRSVTYTSVHAHKQPQINWLTHRLKDYERVVLDSYPERAIADCKFAVRCLGDRLSRALYTTTKSKGFDGTFTTDNVVDPLSDWVPPYAPGKGDCWRGVDRTTDPARLAGQRLNASGAVASEALILADQLGVREGSDEDEPLYVNPITHCRIPKSDRRASMVLDYSCPEDTIWRLPDGCLEILSAWHAPQLLDWDSRPIVRRDDGKMEVRLGFYGNTVMKNVGKVVRIMGLSLPEVKPSATWVIGSGRPFSELPTLKEPASDVCESTILSYGKMPAPVVTPPAIAEKACPNPTCGKMNDVGTTKCWFCTGSLT